MSALEIFRQLPSTKSDIEYWRQSAKLDILNGGYNSNELAELPTIVKKAEMVLEIFADKEVKKVIRDAIDLQPEKVILNSCEIQRRLTPGTWDYKECGDTVLSKLEKEAVKITEKIKTRKAFLQNIPDEGVADTDTGQIISKAKFTKGDLSYAIKVL